MSMPPLRPRPRSRIPASPVSRIPASAPPPTPRIPARPAPVVTPRPVHALPPAAAPELPRRDRSVRRSSTAISVLGIVAIVLALIVCLTAGTPLIGASWNWEVLSVGAAVVVGADYLLRQHLAGASLRTLGVTAALCVLVFALYAIGVSQSVIIGGHVYFNDSPTARADRTYAAITTAINQLVAGDALLTLPPAQARANLASFQPAIDAANSINTTYFKTIASPSTFQDAYVALGNAAYWESQALAAGLSELTQSGSDATGTIASDRAQFLTDLAAARQAAVSDARFYHLPVKP